METGYKTQIGISIVVVVECGRQVWAQSQVMQQLVWYPGIDIVRTFLVAYIFWMAADKTSWKEIIDTVGASGNGNHVLLAEGIA